ncbi:MAG: DNA internalization-related competence protein ComEC/Rec2 [Candidatus Omnitrophota bacterium]
MKRPFVPIAISLILGISFARMWAIPFSWASAAGLLCLIPVLLFSKQKIISRAFLCISVALIGVISYGKFNAIPVDHISRFNSREERTVMVRGTIIDDPVISTTFYSTRRTSFVLEVNGLKGASGFQRASGLVKVDMYKDEKGFGYGDEVVLEGILSPPAGLRNPGLFDYSEYLKNKRIYSVLKVKRSSAAHRLGEDTMDPVRRLAYRVRRWIEGYLDARLERRESGFLKALIVGDRSGLDERTEEDFVKTGTVHILAVSGQNVGFVAGIFLFIFSIFKVPKRLNLALATGAVIFYSFVAGGAPPVARAAITFSIFAAGYLFERESDILNSLAIAAVLILIFNPNELFDPSFQLSFISLAGIILLTPKIEGVLMRPGRPARRASRFYSARVFIIRSVVISIAAWIAIAPVVSFYFNITSPIAVVANIVIVPLVFVIFALSMVFLGFGLIPGLPAAYLSAAMSITEKALFFINGVFAKAPFAYFRTPAPTPYFCIVYYAFFIVLFLSPAVINAGRRPVRRRDILAVILVILNVMVWKDLLPRQKEILEMTFFDAGQGDSTLIELPRGGVFLVDGGSGGEEKFDIGKRVIAPYLWNKKIRRIDAIVVSHLHEDHLGGIIYLMQNFKVGCVIDNGAVPERDKWLYLRYAEIVKAKRIPRVIVGSGDEIDLPGPVRIFVLNPKKEKAVFDSNDNSIVLKIVYGASSVLLCGDVTEKGISDLVSYGDLLRSDILKVPHHAGFPGSENIFRIFFKAVSPGVAIISVGNSVKFKERLNSTVDILTHLGSRCYITKQGGAIRAIINEGGFKIGHFGEEN